MDSGRDGLKLGNGWERGKVGNFIIEWGERLVGHRRSEAAGRIIT